uniref:Uncharacterized protein n=1 Tax=Brassica oleracea var. oleracea TaxID=109376 RepID=A0A0D3BQD6_BRAOL
HWGIPTKKYPSASSSQGGWSNGGGGGADGKRNRPPRTPGSENNFARITGHRVDMFTSEEQELLSDVEPVMRRLRNIMHHSGYTDGEPISDDDKTYVLEQIFNFHPEKESKLGSGLDFITVYSILLLLVERLLLISTQRSRCFFVVSTDGVKQDLSYRKCINNYLVEKYPNLAEEFIAKYYKKRDNANRVRNSKTTTNHLETPPLVKKSRLVMEVKTLRHKLLVMEVEILRHRLNLLVTEVKTPRHSLRLRLNLLVG